MKIGSITHKDFDGIVAQIIVLGVYGRDNVDYCCTLPHKVDGVIQQFLDRCDEYDKVFITDISPSVELAKKLPPHFYVIDHHDTAKDLRGLGSNFFIDSSGKHSGASLSYSFFDYILKKQKSKLDISHLKSIVDVATYYDLWKFDGCDCVKDYDNLTYCDDCTLAHNINYLFYYYWENKFIRRFWQGNITFYDDEKEAIENDRIDAIKVIKNLDFMEFCDDIMYVEADSHINQVAENVLYVKNKNMVIIHNSKRNVLSIRLNKSVKNLNVGEELTKFGGGGHPRAAGVSINTLDDVKDIMSHFELLLKENKNE